MNNDIYKDKTTGATALDHDLMTATTNTPSRILFTPTLPRQDPLRPQDGSDLIMTQPRTAALAQGHHAQSFSTAAPAHNTTLTHTHSLPTSGPAPLFQLVNFPTRLVLENVYLNGTPSLRRFGIRNTGSIDIVVKMRSSLGPQVSFQHSPDPSISDPDQTQELNAISTNTAQAAEAGSSSSSSSTLYSNPANTVDEIAIPAGHTKFVLLGFLPDPRGKNRRPKWESSAATLDLNHTNSGNGSAHNDGVQIFDDTRQRDISASGLVNGSSHEADEFESTDQQTDSYDSFEVNGLVFFFAYKVSTSSGEASGILDGLDASSKVSSTDPTFVSSPPSFHPPTQQNDTTATPTTPAPSQPSSESSSSIPPVVASNTTPHKADYQHTVKFRSTVCRSVLYSNIGETGIDFEDCVANETYVKDFTLWNRSEIPLYWQLKTVDAGSAARDEWLKFVDYEDSFGNDDEKDRIDEQGQAQSSRDILSKPIPSYGYRRIRVIFKPRETGDFLFDLTLKNLNDPTNMEEVAIHATVRAVSRGEETLVLSTGNAMDFGDCCAGMWTRLPMTFTNTGTGPIEVHLKVEGAEVVFDIQTEPGAELNPGELEPAPEEKTSGWFEGSRRSETSVHTDRTQEQSPSGGSGARSRLRDWMEEGPQSPGAAGFASSVASVADSVGMKGDRSNKEQQVDSSPSSPVTSEGFFPDNISQINSNVEKYLAGQELGRPGQDGNEEELESEADTTSLQDSLATNNSMALSHKKRPSLRSISFSGAQREKELAQSQLHAPPSPARGNQSTTRIEELFVKPGKERTVIVSYRPAADTSMDNVQAAKLTKKSFRIVVSYAPWGGLGSTISFNENTQKERKMIQCKARSCTSFVTFEPKALDFGDTDVGQLKSLPIKLMNLSELPATVQLDFQSKVLNCIPSGAITIPAKSTTELKLDIYPRKVNPDYRKQLTLINLTNRANDQIIEVRSTNIDKNRVTFHSLFYRVVYPGGSNFLDFGTVVVGGVSLRIITISNITKEWLTLEVTTSLANELTVYERAREHQTYLNVNKVDGLLTDHQEPSALSALTNGSGPGDQSRAATREASPSFLESNASAASIAESTKPTHLKRRQDTRDHHSSATSDSGTPMVIGSAALASSLALKAKAILFHGDLSQTVSSTPSRFLDLATNKPKENKRIMRRIPTMKELLEPKAAVKTGPLDRSGKSNSTNPQDPSRSPRSQMKDQQGSGVAVMDSNSKKSEASNGQNQRQQDSKASQNDTKGQTSAEGPLPNHPLLTARPLDSVLTTMDANSAAGGSMLFFKPADEELYVKDKMKLTRELQNAITSGELSPVSVVSVPPETEHQLVIMFTPSSSAREHIKGIPKKQDARMFLRLVDFDRDTVASNPQFRALLEGDLAQIPLREIVVRSSLFRSIMELGQNNINFGLMDKGEKRTKTIVIQNRSKEPMLYHIRKSGSIASGDIVLGHGKSGVVRGYSKKEVDFIFEPSLSGLYHEKLAIENVQDRDSSKILSVKANIRKPKHFSIQSQEIDFGGCVVGTKTLAQGIVVTNSTKQTRTFEVRVDPHEMMPLSTECYYGGQIEFTLEDDPAGKAVVTKEMEDEIEILEQKLKIAKRKGRADKVLKVTARLSLLRKGGVEDKVESPKPSEADDATPTQEKVLEFKNDVSSSPTVEASGKGSAANSPVSSTPATTPIIKDAPKFKRTDHSIVFTLEGGKTKSVSAYFTALCDQSAIAAGIVAPKDRLRLQGKIYVHEHKNRDICRDVSFFVTIEGKGLPNGKTGDGKGQEDLLTSTSVKSRATLEDKGEKDGDAIAESTMNSHSSTKDSAAFDENPAPEVPVVTTEHLALSPSMFDAGKIEQGQKGTYYFKLSNSSDQPLPFVIELDRDTKGCSRYIFEEGALKGSLAPMETRRISFGYSCQDLGRLEDTLRVVNLATHGSFPFTMTCYSHWAQYLAFPSLDESMKLDLGYCYVDTGRKYSQVTPLLVENITDEDIYISCASNLSQQVGIYLDERAQKGHVTRTFLKKRSMVTVWVAVQPNLLGGIAGGSSSRRAAANASGLGSSTKDRDSECRTLVGGIKFTISAPEEDVGASSEKTPVLPEATTQEEALVPVVPITSQTVKFTSVIGRSILSVSDTLLNLGWTPDVGKPVYGSFTLQNMSSRLPLDFHVESMSGNIILDRTGGILDGWDVEATSPCPHDSDRDLIKAEGSDSKETFEAEGTEAEQMDRSRIWISFRVTATAPGLLTDTILVTNENNCSQQIEIKVRMFVDSKQLSTSLHGPGYSCPMTLEDVTEIQDGKPDAPREGLNLPSLTWENVYVNIHEEQDEQGEGTHPIVNFQPPTGEPDAHVEERWIELSNDGDELMELVPLSDIDVDAFWETGMGNTHELEILGDEESKPLDGLHFCGAVVRVGAKEKVQLLVSCPIPDVPHADVGRLQSGKNVTLSGNLMVMDRVKRQIVKVLVLSSTFGVSYGKVVPLSTDLGKIGHYNNWQQARLKFDVKNSCEIPLRYEIVLQDYMELVAPTVTISADGEGSPTLTPRSTKRTLPSHGSDKIEIMLDPKRIQDFEMGRRSFPIRIQNLNNPDNETTFNVHAMLTEFELGFDRLTDGNLVLPPMVHPLPSTALPCDAWFSITNKSPEDVRFEIGATLSPDVVDYVHLDVLSRFSNSPLRGNISLSPQQSIEVRVRAFPKEGSRLPSDTSALCTPDGLTFGKLWVKTKSILAEDESQATRFAEDIPIRGTLVEGSMFSLSTHRIVFRGLLETSDEEGESDDEQVSAPGPSAYPSSKDVSDDDLESSVQQASIVVSNLSMNFPLEFQMTLEGPMEYPAAEIIKVTPLDSNNCGTVEAGQQLKLTVELIDLRLIISEDIKLYIRNLNSKMGQQQRVLISIVSDDREQRKHGKKQQALEDERIDPHHHQNKLLEETPTPTNGTNGVPSLLSQQQSLMNPNDADTMAMQPVISLRGCKRIDSTDALGGRFELDLGQQDMGSTHVLRKLVLENLGYDRVSYRIKTISALDRNWIKMSRTDGTLEPPPMMDEALMGSISNPSSGGSSSTSSSVHTISLSFATNVRNVFSTYLLVENVDNPADTKTIRVTMEVVARQNLRRATKGNEANNRVFDVFVNGIDYKNSASIDMKNLYYGSEYTARSMVVYNRESVPMEFTFKSNLSPSDATEILFSTSRTSAKLFKTLTVPSENHVRVYIRFFPRPSAAIQAALDQGEYRDPEQMELKTVEIYINCRLVKDYQQVVVLKAECYLPAIRVDWQDSVSFVGRLTRVPTTNNSSATPTSASAGAIHSSATVASVASSGTSGATPSEAEEWKLWFQEDVRILSISNLLNIPLEYEIVNDTMYFNLGYPETDKVIDPLDSHQIRVVPNVKALLRNAENFRREKYVQENITIYNRNRPLENYWIPLRLSFGNVSNFQLSSGYKSSYAFGMIEQHVVNFLSDFNSHAVLVTMGSSGYFTGGAGVGTGHGSGPGSLVGSPTMNGGRGAGLILPSGSSPTSVSSSRALTPTTLTSATAAATVSLTPTPGTVAGMLGLGRTPSVYHPPAHHPHYQSAEAQETQRKLLDLEFQYHYVVDQLVYYSTIKTGENFFQLASLLFCTLLGNRIFQIWSPAYLRDPRVSAAAATTARNRGTTDGGMTAGPGVGSLVGSPSSSSLSTLAQMAGATSPGGGDREDVGPSSNGFMMMNFLNQHHPAATLYNLSLRPPPPTPASTPLAGAASFGSVGDSLSTGSVPAAGAAAVNTGGAVPASGTTDGGSGTGGEDEEQEEEVRVWPESLRKWVEALDYFVSFFPYHTRQLETLKSLHHSLISS